MCSTCNYEFCYQEYRFDEAILSIGTKEDRLKLKDTHLKFKKVQFNDMQMCFWFSFNELMYYFETNE